MVFERSDIENEEVFLGTYTQKDIDAFFSNLIKVRQEKKYNRGVIVYFDVFVAGKELRNFLLQAEEDLREEKGKIEKQKQVFRALSMLPDVDMGGEPIFDDEVFVGFYRSAELMKSDYGCGFDNFRKGSPAEFEMVNIYGRDGKLRKILCEPAYYFFADKGQFMVYLNELKEAIVQNCESYKYMKKYYEEMKKFQGG